MGQVGTRIPTVCKSSLLVSWTHMEWSQAIKGILHIGKRLEDVTRTHFPAVIRQKFQRALHGFGCIAHLESPNPPEGVFLHSRFNP